MRGPVPRSPTPKSKERATPSLYLAKIDPAEAMKEKEKEKEKEMLAVLTHRMYLRTLTDMASTELWSLPKCKVRGRSQGLCDGLDSLVS